MCLIWVNLSNGHRQGLIEVWMERMVDEEKKHNPNENIFLNALAIFGLWSWFSLFTGITRGEWVNPWNVLPSWLMDTMLIGFTVGWLFSMAFFIAPLFTLLALFKLLKR